jgi:hypothetical protein
LDGRFDSTGGGVEEQTTKNPLNVSIQRAHVLVPRVGVEPTRGVTPADFECRACVNLMFSFNALTSPVAEFVLSLLVNFFALSVKSPA